MKHLLRAAQEEILQQGRRIDILQAKVDVMDLFAHAFHARLPPQGMGMDIAFSLGRAAEEIEKTEGKPEPHEPQRPAVAICPECSAPTE